MGETIVCENLELLRLPKKHNALQLAAFFFFSPQLFPKRRVQDTDLIFKGKKKSLIKGKKKSLMEAVATVYVLNKFVF